MAFPGVAKNAVYGLWNQLNLFVNDRLSIDVNIKREMILPYKKNQESRLTI